MSKYDKIGNYNLSYELLKEAVNDFDGYIAGLSQNDIWLFSNKISRVKAKPEGDVKDNLVTFLKNISPRILDRTTGTYFFINLLYAEQIPALSPYVTDIGIAALFSGNNKLSVPFSRDVMTFIPGYYPQGLGSGGNRLVSSMVGFVQESQLTDTKLKELTDSGQVLNFNNLDLLTGWLDTNTGATKISIWNEQLQSYNAYQLGPNTSKLFSMNDCLNYYDVTGIIKEKVIKEVKDKKTGKKTQEIQYEDDDKKKPKMYSADAAVDSTILRTPRINLGNKKGIPDRFSSPSLGSIVMHHPKASIAGKGKDHLPIFFNAIPPIEMSRCTPYIDVRVLTENYQIDPLGRKKKPSKLNNVMYMRFIKDEGNGYFTLDDSVGFGDLKPVSNSIKQDEREALKNIDMSYMDIFTTPQTFSNANVNSSKGKFLKNIAGDVEMDPILEPIMPFLSLESMNVSITGAGYGIMASKNANLKLTLHDRSRLRDLAPLVSSSQFATTRILIEYGWNHPEGGPNSQNVIGKYLNALKDRSVYQVVKCDYDFSDGGAVGISLGLAAYGFRQTERVHCGAGPEVPMNVFSEYIDKVGEDLIKSAENDYGKEKAPEIRQKIKLNERAARSTMNSISWNAYSIIMKALRNHKTDAIKVMQAIFEIESIVNVKDRNAKINAFKSRFKLLDKNSLSIEGAFTNRLEMFNNLEKAGLFQEDEKETMLQRVYGKIKAFEDEDIGDPFISSLVYGSKMRDSLRKLNFDTLTAAEQKKSLVTLSNDTPGEYVTLGKAIASLVGYPLAATCLYDEVQMIFYPLNHQSGGARIHTTASLPIPIKKIREQVQNAVKTSSNISVKRMFSLLENIVKDRNLPVYGISNLFYDKDNFSEKTENQQLECILDIICPKDGDQPGANNLGFNPSSDLVDKLILEYYNANVKTGVGNQEALESGFFSKAFDGGKLRIRLNKYLSTYKKNKGLKLKKDIAEELELLYGKDGLSVDFPGFDRFVRPNLSLDFEVIDAIDGSQSDISGFGAKLMSIVMPPKDVNNGLHDGKTILRIHVYDEETVASPAELTLLSTVTEGITGELIQGSGVKQSISKIAKSMNFNQAKQYIKRAYPTIIYGAAGSTVRSLGVSANTSGEMANILMVESYGNLKQAQVSGMGEETNFESVTLFPNTVTCTLQGMPMIGRGNTIFIDFGTNTSLDNIYTVKNVTHTIRAGDFSTTLDLVPSNMGAIEGFAKNIGKTYGAKPINPESE